MVGIQYLRPVRGKCGESAGMSTPVPSLSRRKEFRAHATKGASIALHFAPLFLIAPLFQFAPLLHPSHLVISMYTSPRPHHYYPFYVLNVTYTTTHQRYFDSCFESFCRPTLLPCSPLRPPSPYKKHVNT